MEKKDNVINRLIIRIIKFLEFQYLFRTRNIKYFLLRLTAKNKTLIKRVQGSKMVLDLNDKGITKDLVLDGIREIESTNEVKKILKKGDVVVEIGANIGYYALIESRLVGERGKICAIEPSQRNLNYLNKNIGLNKISNIDVFQFAIGDKKGITKMNISPHSNLNSLRYNKKRNYLKTADVSQITLDEFLKNKKYPDFIRMDLEGYEINVLNGMKRTLKAKKPLKIFMELHPNLLSKEETKYVLQTLMAYGFETKRVIRGITNPEHRVMDRKEYDYSSKKIQDLLKDSSFISGEKGASRIFFERN